MTWAENSLVRIRNVGTKTWKDTFNNQTYYLDPGQDAIVPFVGACLWFGHPEAVDLGPGKLYRNEELTRLRIRYGAFDGQDNDGNRFTSDEMWARNVPSVEVYTIDTGERVIMVIDDPTGRALTPATQSIAEREVMQQQMLQMTAQVEAMRAEIERMNREQQARDNSGPIVSDSPKVNVDERETVPTEDTEVVEDSPSGRIKVK